MNFILSFFTGVLILFIYSNLWHILAQNTHRTEPTDGILWFECHIEKTTYRIYCNKRPLPINRPPPPFSLPLQSSYFGVLHPSQQPTPLRFRDSQKWCILVLPKRISLTRNKENKNKTWQFLSQTH